MTDLVLRDPFERTHTSIYPKGTILFEQGSVVQEVYLLEQGMVKNLSFQEDGSAVIIWLCDTPGIYLGAICAITGEVEVTTELVTQCRLKRVTARAFREAVRSDAALSWTLHQSHCRLLNQLARKLVGPPPV